MKPLVSFLNEDYIVKESKYVTAMEKHGGENAMKRAKHAGAQMYAEVYMFDFTITYNNNEVKTYTADQFGYKHKQRIDGFDLRDAKSISARFIIDYGFYEEDDDRSWDWSLGDCEVLWTREFEGRNNFTERWESVRRFKDDRDYKRFIIEAMDKTLKSIFSEYYRYNHIEDEKAFEKAL